MRKKRKPIMSKSEAQDLILQGFDQRDVWRWYHERRNDDPYLSEMMKITTRLEILIWILVGIAGTLLWHFQPFA